MTVNIWKLSCKLWLKKRIWKWSLQLCSSESLCLKCRKGLNFFRPYFHYYLSSVHITVRVTSILLLFNCSSHIWFSYIYSHLLTTSQDWFDIHDIQVLHHWLKTATKSCQNNLNKSATYNFSAIFSIIGWRPALYFNSGTRIILLPAIILKRIFPLHPTLTVSYKEKKTKGWLQSEN